jgi:hypothetical protein
MIITGECEVEREILGVAIHIDCKTWSNQLLCKFMVGDGENPMVDFRSVKVEVDDLSVGSRCKEPPAAANEEIRIGVPLERGERFERRCSNSICFARTIDFERLKDKVPELAIVVEFEWPVWPVQTRLDRFTISQIQVYPD